MIKADGTRMPIPVAPNPEGAPREQWFEYGVIRALEGGDIIASFANMDLIATLIKAYNDKWQSLTQA